MSAAPHHGAGGRRVLAGAWRLYLADLPALAWVTLALLAWATVIPALVAYSTADAVVVVDRQVRFTYADEAAADAAELVEVVFAGLLAAALLVTEVALAAMVAHRHRTQDAADRRTEMRRAVRRAPSALWIGLLVGTAVAVAFLVLRPTAAVPWWLAAIGAGYVFAMLATALPALAIDDVRGFAALRRSWRLAAPRRWMTIGVVLLAGSAAALLQLAGLGVIVGAATAVDHAGLIVATTTVIGVGLQCVAVPFVAAVLAVLYLHLSERAEASAVTPPPPGPAATG